MIDLINSDDRINTTKLNEAKNLIFITLPYSSISPFSLKSMIVIPTKARLVSIKKIIANQGSLGYRKPAIRKIPARNIPTKKKRTFFRPKRIANVVSPRFSSSAIWKIWLAGYKLNTIKATPKATAPSAKPNSCCPPANIPIKYEFVPVLTPIATRLKIGSPFQRAKGEEYNQNRIILVA